MKVLSRTDLPVSEKVYLAASMITMSEPSGEVSRLAERFELSRPTLYDLKEEAQRAFCAQFEPLGSEPGVLWIRLDRAQLERAAVALRTVGPNSIPVILELLPLLYPGLELSYGKLHAILAEAESKAKEFNERVTLRGIVAAALDEMFSQGQPILTGIDLDSGFVAILKAAEGRSGEDWAEALRAAKRQDFSPVQIVKDAGTGMDAGLDIELREVERRDDSFHAVYELGKVLSRLERSAYAAIGQEAEAELELKKKVAKGADQRGAAQRLRRAQERCKPLVERFDALEAEVRRVREVLEAVDVRTRTLRSPERMNRELTACAKRIGRLPDASCKKVGRYLENRTPGLVLYCKELYEALGRLGQQWGSEAVRFAAVLWQAAELLHQRRARWNRNLQLEALAAGWRGLRALLHPERATLLLQAVAALFEQRHRASSALEGFHAGLRPHLYVHKGVSQGFLELYRAYHNLHTTRSGRNKGTSAYERLTGEKVEDWPSVIGFPPSDQASRN
jgi:hypothetical protein